MKTNKSSDAKNQSARLIEAAKKTGADESGKAFEKAFKKIAPPVRRKSSKPWTQGWVAGQRIAG
jgi:hypothetical protein